MRTNIKRIRKTLVAEEEVTRFLSWVKRKDNEVSLTPDQWNKALAVSRSEGFIAARDYLSTLKKQRIRKVSNGAS